MIGGKEVGGGRERRNTCRKMSHFLLKIMSYTMMLVLSVRITQLNSFGCVLSNSENF